MTTAPPRARLAAVLATAALALAGCGGTDGDDAPEPSDPALVAATADLHLLEARAARTGDVPPRLRDSVLASYGLDRAGYAEALERLTERPEAYAALLASVQARLGTLDSLGRPRTPLDSLAASQDSVAGAAGFRPLKRRPSSVSL